MDDDRFIIIFYFQAFDSDEKGYRPICDGQLSGIVNRNTRRRILKKRLFKEE